MRSSADQSLTVSRTATRNRGRSATADSARVTRSRTWWKAAVVTMEAAWSDVARQMTAYSWVACQCRAISRATVGPVSPSGLALSWAARLSSDSPGAPGYGG